MTKERTRTDPDVAKKLAELAEDVKTDPFPLPRIEDIALTAKSRLNSLKDSLSQEDLDSLHSTDDPLLGMLYNDRFVREHVSPLMLRLLQRTDGIVTFTQDVFFGYASTVENDEDTDPEVRLVVDDAGLDYKRVIGDSADMQEAWDTSHPTIREAMRFFGSSSKEQIIDSFSSYIEEYVPR